MRTAGKFERRLDKFFKTLSKNIKKLVSREYVCVDCQRKGKPIIFESDELLEKHYKREHRK